MPQLTKDLLVLLGECVQVLFDALDALPDRRIRRRLQPLREARSQALNHADGSPRSLVVSPFSRIVTSMDYPSSAPVRDGGAVGRPAILAGTVGLAIAGFLYRFLTIEFLNDHFVHLSRGYQIVRGEVPVRDFFDPGLI